MTILWIIVNCAACAWFSHAVLSNPVFRAAIRKWGSRAADNAAIALLTTLLLLHGGVAAAVYVTISAGATVLTTSLLAFAWANTAYFILQRFAGPLEQPFMVDKNRSFLPLASFIAFTASTTACILYGGWFLACLPIATWLILGFTCAEIAVRRYMRRSRESGTDCTRDLGIFAVNDAQGRRGFMTTGRYPFP